MTLDVATPRSGRCRVDVEELRRPIGVPSLVDTVDGLPTRPLLMAGAVGEVV